MTENLTTTKLHSLNCRQGPQIARPMKQMTTPILETKGFAAAVIDALASHICIIDENGVIVAVNRAWSNFSIDNPPTSARSGVGTHYLGVCRNCSGPGSEEAEAFARGVQDVLEGRTELFQLEYPCHSPDQHRWYLGRVTPLRAQKRGAVISHLNITDRKLMEIELARLAATDVLTGLPNRRYFLEHAERELERVRRFKASASVVMFDLDHFKAVNDSYGHGLGDESLRTVSRNCSALLREFDVLARYGGEEFVVLLPGTDEASASVVAEKLRQVISATPVRDGNHEIDLTASFGVSNMWISDGSIQDSLDRADAALYAAKGLGRNRVITHSRNPSPDLKMTA